MIPTPPHRHASARCDRIPFFCTAFALLCALFLSACGAKGSSPYTPQSESGRNPIEAERLNREAAAHLSSNPKLAESLVRRALAHDLYCGPAHNNLGVLLLQEGRLYEAAAEFEWARKLIPGNPEPRLNLALALDRAGRRGDAIVACRAALEIAPDHIPAMQHLASMQLRAGTADNETRAMLTRIAEAGESEAWRLWAREQSLRLESRDSSPRGQLRPPADARPAGPDATAL